MKLGARSTTGWRATIAVAMSNYIEAGFERAYWTRESTMDTEVAV